ncbi:MAG: 2-hydroxycarboxylate transporter family protein, partial [Stomatobaculum longum]|nr:2-hydroxycarboxylate transporter family protein [Stomatobaculum longum]
MKREMKRVAGLPLPLYLAVLGLLFLALWRDGIPAGMPGGLFLLLVLGEGLNELGKSVPLVKT